MADKKLVTKLDTIFSQFIRLRDSKNGIGQCCSCGKVVLWKEADAGHFVNRKWFSTRWREDNVHLQCRSCNRFDEGNTAGYSLFMMRKYGEAHIEFLKGIKNQAMKYSDSDLLLLIDHYKKEVKKLK